MLLISEWWASETVVILGGLLPDPERQLSAMNIYQLTNAMCFMLPLGMAVAVGTRFVVQLCMFAWTADYTTAYSQIVAGSSRL